MLGDLLRRLLTLPPVVLLVSALTFSLVADPATTAASPYAHLPRFLNPAPADASERAHLLLARLRLGPDADAALDLARLGGAALPIVLPAFEGLEPDARLRVAEALRPVAARMGLAREETLEQQVLGWRRFWEDRALDFRTPAIRRAVHRFVERPTPGHVRDLLVLDTAALEEMFGLLGADGPLPPGDVAEALVPLAQHALALPPRERAPDGSLSPDVLALRAHWFARRIDYLSLDGPRRAAALFLETQYGKWVQRTVLERAAEVRRGASPLRLMIRRGRWTLARLALGFSLGIALSWLVALLAPPARARRARLVLAAALAFVPLALVGQASAWLIPPVIALAVAQTAGRRLRGALLDDLTSPLAPATLARGVSQLRLRLRTLGRHAPSLYFRSFTADFSVALTVTLVLEWRWRVSGLGGLLVDALQQRDITTLMALGVSAALVVHVTSALAAVLEQHLDPRLGDPP